MAKAATRLFFGAATVDVKTLQTRRDICFRCPKNDAGWCKVCTCYIPLKTEFSTEECPLGHWRKKLTPWGFLNTLYQNARRFKGRL